MSKRANTPISRENVLRLYIRAIERVRMDVFAEIDSDPEEREFRDGIASVQKNLSRAEEDLRELLRETLKESVQ